ncbi:hypothetical protein K470DRAFT_254771 [Piedraia hortae CBS 480.64]|uniref:RRM domain-containing protein n=1 Tax=Piedraia hortae CBS 480.64 TaxID=1314780 RepID=A0A6A7C8Q3_9PEZI|nr:hypothetical protein K470DRAFT_254771 [Piedraia hortae CBS 480.64]
MNREKGGRVVFIGNIPYGVSEEQICELFSSAGQVLSFRLVYDKETGKPKGFGFLEYADVDSAATAVRNLNGTELNGRSLRVDYSNDNGGGRSNARDNDTSSGRAAPPAHFNVDMVSNSATDGASLPPLPAGVPLPPNISAPDAISQTLANMPVQQLLDTISQLKNLAHSNPQQATMLFSNMPQLGYATFQALLLLGLVDTSVLSSLIQQTQQAPPPQPAPIMPPGYGQSRPLYPPHPGFPPPTMHHYAPTPPVQHPAYAAPPQVPPQMPQTQPLPTDPKQLAVVQQILSMTKEQIYALDEGTRGQLMTLRQMYGAPPI